LNLEINCPKGFDDAHEALKARADILHLMGRLAAKWPYGLALQSGGPTRAIEVQEKAHIRSILYAFRHFLHIADALEQALIDAPVRAGEVDPVAVQHIVRSFNPCMVCTVH